MKSLIFIPARGGSKTIEMKNLAILNGEPLLHYVCKAAKKEPLDHIVSSDNRTILDFAESRGMKTFRRSPENEDGPVVNAVLEYLDYTSIKYEVVILLQPTSPFIRHIDIEVVKAALYNDWPLASAFTMIPVPHRMHLENQRIMGFNGNLTRFGRQSRKQDKDQTYAFGNVVATRTDALHTDQGMFPYPSKGIKINPYSAMDLDQPEDFVIAEALMKQGVIKV